MAAWIPKNTVKLTRGYNACATSYAIQLCCYSSQKPIIKNPTTAKLKRGTGGRSSFSGIVCTVFGATGFLGAAVCNQLGKRGCQIIVPYRGDIYAAQRLKLCGDLGQVLFHPFHLRDEESIARCVKYSNVVVNLIGHERETRNFTYDDVHDTGARTLARICRESNVERFIHLTRITAREDHEGRLIKSGSRLLKSKWNGECAVREEFPDATIIRAADIFDFGDRFTKLYFNPFRYFFGELPMWKKGEQTEKQPVFISDVSAGIMEIMMNSRTAGKTYQFIGPRRYLLSELVDWINRIRTGVPSNRLPMELLLPYKALVTVYEASHLKNIFEDVHWERLELESQSDLLVPAVPTLEDLGVNLTPLEDVVGQFARANSKLGTYEEFENILYPIDPPKTLPIPL